MENPHNVSHSHPTPILQSRYFILLQPLLPGLSLVPTITSHHSISGPSSPTNQPLSSTTAAVLTKNTSKHREWLIEPTYPSLATIATLASYPAGRPLRRHHQQIAQPLPANQPITVHRRIRPPSFLRACFRPARGGARRQGKIYCSCTGRR